jgi:Ca2+:H+ antiporter
MVPQAHRFSWHAFVVPVVAFATGFVLVVVAPHREDDSVISGVVGSGALILLALTVVATLRHAERVSHMFGRVAGTIAFTVAANVVEVSIIAFMMLHKENNPTLARDTVVGIVMVTCCGVIGACLVLGAIKHRQQAVDSQATSAYLSVLVALVTIFLVLPSFLPPRTAWREQARDVITAVISLALYGLFLGIKVVSGRAEAGRGQASAAMRKGGLTPLLLSGLFALLGLAGIVFLAKEVSTDVEDLLVQFGIVNTDAIVGATVAMLVLLPESLDALHAATRRSVQNSLDIALGAALASIGLLIPSIVLIGAMTGREVILGVDQPGIVILALTLVLSIISFGSGRTNVLTGAVHLVVFGMFVLMLFA